MAPERLRSRALSAFKLRGLLLRGEAIKYLTEALQSVSEVELEDALEKIIDAVEKQPLSSNMIERSVVEAAVQECSQSVDETIEHIFNIIGAFDIPRFVYNSERKKFLPLLMTNHPKPNLFGTARDKAELFRERYTILHQRTHRHELFTPPVIGSHPDESGSKFQLKTIETLLGNTTKIGDVIVLGMITQLKEGKFFLEDPTGTVQLDLSKAQFHSGLYTESCFVLAEGWFEDQVFHVNAFGFPPTEPSSTTRAYYGNINFFGGPSNTSVKTSAKLKQLEDENKDSMFVFISDVWLDQAEVLEKLHTMFSDKYDPFTLTNTECLCINPGSFPRSGFSFKVFYPSNKTVEDSKLQGF
uniref:DNA polymerase epsilon subunit 2 n=1 Tax=Pipistrellus kuhlii TaxID=59472 RepID=A0A7J8B3M8_PIPKU|nr:DNA polymerase epsilon 2, accessory subunit [Pipistrellus kuhlii]